MNEDLEDLLEQLRVLLNNSKIEQMHYFHTHSIHKKGCGYYIKSKLLWDNFEKKDVMELLRKIGEYRHD